MIKKRKVLFVDDELRVLRGMRNALVAAGCDWQMSLAQSAGAALEMLRTEPFDAIVSDMQMPGTDGVALLYESQMRYPSVVRIALSAHTDFEATLRALPVAHQYLVKPCDAQTIRETVQRACTLHEMIGDEEALRCVIRTKDLPSAPSVYTNLTRLMARPNVSMNDVAAVVEQDAPLTARVFHIVNSAAFSLRHEVRSIQDAIKYVGLDTVKDLVLVLDAFRSLETQWKDHGLSLDDVYLHSLAVGSVARRLLADRTEAQHAFTAGVLHDIGKVVLMTQQPQRYGEVLDEFGATGLRLHELEERRLRVTHAEVGGVLLSSWQLPYPVVEAVAAHHRPLRIRHARFGVLSAVHIADRLVHESTEPAQNGRKPWMRYLKRLNVDQYQQQWLKLAQKIVADLEQ